jgi:hypothetical protein
MPFYANDNMTCWFYTLIEEMYDNATDEPERQAEIREAVMAISIAPLHQICVTAMEDYPHMPESFLQAVLNSVDCVLLKNLLKEYIEHADD